MEEVGKRRGGEGKRREERVIGREENKKRKVEWVGG